MKTAAVWILIAATGGAVGLAQSPEDAARPLTVELFASHKIDALTITPLGQNETAKLCAGCRAKKVRQPLIVRVQGDAVDLGKNTSAHELEMDGAYRLLPDGGAKPIAAAGVWKIAVSHGALRVLLTMDSERYVALALRGEAGAKEPIESLKAMAIAVRTFALENASRHRGDGFDLCDSTHCQALKFGTPSERVERAVRETAGETLWYGSRRAMVFYTQNCGGRSEDASQAWPGTRAQYLKARADPYCMRHGAAQWHAEISVADLERVAQSAGWKLPQKIRAIHLVKRTSEGRVLRLGFLGKDGEVPVSASSLRFALNRALGWNQLRSDWYSVALRSGVLSFDGRGYGHGVGLCQAGATQMATEGRSAAEILQFYFPGTRAGVTATGGLWRPNQQAGWTLWSTSNVGSLAREADAAWGKARALYPPRAPVAAELWVMPTTELFRQETGQPGWVLASTQGTRVFLQREDVLKRTGREERTLLHEFLHVLVEGEASAQTPLWLREGIVEALAENAASRDPAVHFDLHALETDLTRPPNQPASQRAHAEAARLASAFLARNGLEAVRTWIRSGSVPANQIRMLMQVSGKTAVPAQVPSTHR
jgi:stage II sporulation protein D